MVHEDFERFRSRSHALIRGAQAARVVSAESQIAVELRTRLSSLLDALEDCIADRDLWSSLSNADHYFDSSLARGLLSVGAAPWEELLQSGGYTSPPPPTADELAAALSMNVRNALDSDPHELGPRYRAFVLNVRDRLKLHLRILRDRLDLTRKSNAARELNFLAKTTTDAALDTAAALALPAIAAVTVGSGMLSVVTSMLSAVANRTWHAVEEHRDLRRPPTRRFEHDPVLQLLALMMDTVQELRTNAALDLPDAAWDRALTEQYQRQASWMGKLVKSPGLSFPEWREIERFGDAVLGTRQGGFDRPALGHLLTRLEDAFASRAY